MSHFVRIQTQITNRAHLLEALRNLGYTVREGTTVRGWQGNTAQADVVVSINDQPFDVGFSRPAPDAPYEMNGDWWGLRVSQEVFARTVGREVAAVAAVALATQRGFRNVQRQVVDGKIVITGQKA